MLIKLFFLHCGTDYISIWTCYNKLILFQIFNSILYVFDKSIVITRTLYYCSLLLLGPSLVTLFVQPMCRPCRVGEEKADVFKASVCFQTHTSCIVSSNFLQMRKALQVNPLHFCTYPNILKCKIVTPSVSKYKARYFCAGLWCSSLTINIF